MRQLEITPQNETCKKANRRKQEVTLDLMGHIEKIVDHAKDSKLSADFYRTVKIHNDNVKGKTIIDFMQEQIYRESGRLPTLREVGEVLQGYVNSKQTVLPSQSTYNLTREYYSKEDILFSVKSLKTIKNTDFLESRGIDVKLLETQTWKNVFWENRHVDKDTGSCYTNTCVRLQNMEGVQGYSQRNAKFKGAIGNRFDSIASSCFDKKRTIDRLYIGESMIDCISHYQMKKPQGNVLYVSTEGALTEGQIHTINNIFKTYRVEYMAVLFDNDRAGQSYTLKMLGLLSRDKSTFEYTVSAVHNETENNVYINLSIKGDEIDNQEVISKVFKNVLDEYSEHYSIKNLDRTDGISTYEISFPYEKEIMINVARAVGDYKYSERFNIELARNDDFNDDLKEVRNAHKENNIALEL